MLAHDVTAPCGVRCAGVQEGAITHVPSTQDLLAQVPVERVIDTRAWRQRASSTKQARLLLDRGFAVEGCSVVPI